MTEPAPIDLHEGFLECLSSIEPSGSSKPFAIFNTRKDPINPGIGFIGGPSIGLPLSDADAESIKIFGIASSCSKNIDAAVGSTGPNIWEVEASYVRVGNPAWTPFLQDIVEDVAAGLGADTTGTAVSAKLHKLSLYGKGAMLEPCRDSLQNEATPGMFASLVIALPSRHEGGNVFLTSSSDPDIKAFATASASAYDSSYVAWFHDVTHWLQPVTAGRRLTLTYHLVHENLGPDVLAANSDKTAGKLDMLFSYWRKNVEGETSLLGCLLADYSHDLTLSKTTLSEKDQQTISYLQKACDNHGFCIYLADMKRSLEIYEDICDDFNQTPELDQSEAEVTLQRICELDGSVVAKSMNFEDNFLLEKDPFQDVEPDDQVWDDQTGTKAVYFRTIVLIMPKEFRFSWFLTPDRPPLTRNDWGGTTSRGVSYTPDLSFWIDRVYSDALSGARDPNARNDLVEICKTSIGGLQGWKHRPSGADTQQPYTDTDLGKVIRCCVALDLKELFLQAWEMCPPNIPSSTFEYIGYAYVRWELKAMLPVVSKHISGLTQLSSRLAIINAFRAGVSTESLRLDCPSLPYREWALEETDKTISDPAIIASGITSAEDGATLAILCCGMGHDEVFKKILPAIKSNMSYVPAVLTFLRDMHEFALRGSLSTDLTRIVYREVLAIMTPYFHLEALGVPAGKTEEEVPKYAWMPKTAPPPKFDAERSKEIAALLCSCHTLGLNSELALLLEELSREARIREQPFVEDMTLPFMKILGGMLQLVDNIRDSPFPQFYQQTFSIFHQRFVQDRPQPARNWSRPLINCPNCRDCTEMNRFLADPYQIQAEYTYGAKRREHMISMVKDIVDYHSAKKTSTSVSLTLYLTKSSTYIEKAIKRWEQKRAVAIARYRDIEEVTDLRSLLGEYYDVFMDGEERVGMMGSQALGAAMRNESYEELSRQEQAEVRVRGLGASEHDPNRMVIMSEPRGVKRKASEVVVIDD